MQWSRQMVPTSPRLSKNRRDPLSRTRATVIAAQVPV
jgi:hypothetical protein